MGDVDEGQLAVDSTPVQKAICRVALKTFAHHGVSVNINEKIYGRFKSKLWRMGQLLDKHRGGNQRSAILKRWENEQWELLLDRCDLHEETIQGMLKRKDDQLALEATKRIKLDQQNNELMKENEVLKDTVNILMQDNTRRSKSRKNWTCYSTKQQQRKRQELKERVSARLLNVDDHFEATSVSFKNKETRELLTVTYPCDRHAAECSTSIHQENESAQSLTDMLLYVKEKYGISDKAYHELSMLASSMPRSCELKKRQLELNNQFVVSPTPDGTIGVQQSLRSRLHARIRVLKHARSSQQQALDKRVRVKLSADGTRIGRKLHVINITFTVLDEGQKARADSGNHLIAILQAPEKYEHLKCGLDQVCEEVKSTSTLEVEEENYTIEFFLGGDMKFLLMACGLNSANGEYACIWCKCPSHQRFDISKSWSLTDPEKGARTISEIKEMASKKRRGSKYGCVEQPLFPSIPISHVVIDTLHLLLRISDVLMNLLLADLERHDELKKLNLKEFDPSKLPYMAKFQAFLNDDCGIPFEIMINEKKEAKWRDLMGPEKHVLLQKISIPTLFPELSKAEERQEIWTQFYHLYKRICAESFSKDNIDHLQADLKQWMTTFLAVYQSRHVTPYMHSFICHVPEFLTLYGNLTQFTQQGMEKLNDTSTKYYFRATNHHKKDSAALSQLLLKRNRVEELEDQGNIRQKRNLSCSICKESGHNKKTCPNKEMTAVSDETTIISQSQQSSTTN